MNSHFETPSRCSPAGVTTAAILVVMLAMGVSTLLSSETSGPQGTAAAGHSQVAQTHGAVKKS